MKNSLLKRGLARCDLKISSGRNEPERSLMTKCLKVGPPAPTCRLTKLRAAARARESVLKTRKQPSLNYCTQTATTRRLNLRWQFARALRTPLWLDSTDSKVTLCCWNNEGSSKLVEQNVGYQPVWISIGDNVTFERLWSDYWMTRSRWPSMTRFPIAISLGETTISWNSKR